MNHKPFSIYHTFQHPTILYLDPGHNPYHSGNGRNRLSKRWNLPFWVQIPTMEARKYTKVGAFHGILVQILYQGG